ncbi:hypothetical protein NG2371_01479 [Nocardia gamkensis]|nr:hypothetical protein [Nocardia gamkensis]
MFGRPVLLDGLETAWDAISSAPEHPAIYKNIT